MRTLNFYKVFLSDSSDLSVVAVSMSSAVRMAEKHLKEAQTSAIILWVSNVGKMDLPILGDKQ